jgi:hypothetical protein
MMLARADETQVRESTKIINFIIDRLIAKCNGSNYMKPKFQRKKPHTKLPSGGFAMEACAITD